MVDTSSCELQGCRLLLVEDEFLIAEDLKVSLEALGVEVIGPAGSVEEALRLIDHDAARLDAAVLDINLRGERVFPVADALAARNIPFVFTTGYEGIALPHAYARVARCEKPVDKKRLVQLLSRSNRQSVS
jgi:DNA-binding LytR/AlgR family response regulator